MKVILSTTSGGLYGSDYKDLLTKIRKYEHIEISTKSSNSKGPGSCLPGPILGADNEIRVFEPLAITGSQPVEKISTHSFHQKSHSFSNYSQSQYILISSFSSILGESKFDARVLVKTLYFLKCFHNGKRSIKRRKN